MNNNKMAFRALVLAGGLMASLALVAPGPAAAAVLTAQNGMTLYSYDNDAGGKPTCNAFCAIGWPPYAANGEKLGAGWTTVQRANGSLQWAYKGKPVYFYAGDRAKGDAKGNGLEGVWHVVNQ
jgi:predicted lipoprotein with Yx(FWY)xxD motif